MQYALVMAVPTLEKSDFASNTGTAQDSQHADRAT
jgi:hypothetical protein